MLHTPNTVDGISILRIKEWFVVVVFIKESARIAINDGTTQLSG